MSHGRRPGQPFLGCNDCKMCQRCTKGFCTCTDACLGAKFDQERKEAGVLSASLQARIPLWSYPDPTSACQTVLLRAGKVCETLFVQTCDDDDDDDAVARPVPRRGIVYYARLRASYTEWMHSLCPGVSWLDPAHTEGMLPALVLTAGVRDLRIMRKPIDPMRESLRAPQHCLVPLESRNGMPWFGAPQGWDASPTRTFQIVDQYNLRPFVPTWFGTAIAGLQRCKRKLDALTIGALSLSLPRVLMTLVCDYLELVNPEWAKFATHGELPRTWALTA